MRGFFDIPAMAKPDRRTLSCISCGLYKFTMSPKMPPYGKFQKGIMVIGEGPGEEEDKKGKPWQGKMGCVLQQKYKQLGIDLFNDCISLNAVNCRPVDKKGNNRPPTDYEIACCRQKVLSAIKTYEPKLIILQGAAAVSSLIGHKWKGGPSGVTAWRGWAIPDREFAAWICPTFHPSFIERQEGQNEVDVLWGRDLKRAFTLLSETFPLFKEEKDSIILHEEKDIEDSLYTIYKHARQADRLAFDIETTGLKPYNSGAHKIVTISFCYDEAYAHAMPFPTKAKPLRVLRRILQDAKIGKIAANIKYEDNWLVTLYGIYTFPWVFDTMQAAHILDNRPGIVGLKFQAYVHFGTPSYDDDISPYLKSPEANTPNRIMELVEDKDSFRKLLLYNGIDSLCTFRLAKKQMSWIGGE